MLQCFGQSYDSSGSQTIVSEAAMDDDQTWIHLSWIHIKQIPCFCYYGNDNFLPSEESAIVKVYTL